MRVLVGLKMSIKMLQYLIRALSRTYRSTPFASAEASVCPRPKSMKHNCKGELEIAK